MRGVFLCFVLERCSSAGSWWRCAFVACVAQPGRGGGVACVA